MELIIKPCVFDTNLLIYYLNASLTKPVRQQVDKIIEIGAFISVITRIEVLSWTNHTEESLKSTEELKLPDAIIAATALHLDLPLMTRNIKDFQKVPDLKLINPFEPESNS